MDECFKCGVSGEEKLLVDAISSEGIILICENCLKDEDLPLLRRSEETPKKESFPIQGVRHIHTKSELLGKQEVTLRDIVERNFEAKLPQEKKLTPDLIDNFHWVLMRARRAKKVTHKQMAQEIAESEIALKMAEQGTLPEDYSELVDKLEKYLGIRIRKQGEKKEIIKREIPKRLSFDKDVTKSLTIADLKKMKKNETSYEVPPGTRASNEVPSYEGKSPEFRKKPIDSVNVELSIEGKKLEEPEKDKELSDEEIDDILFGR